MNIRRATAGDAQAIAEIYNESVLNSAATFDTEPKSREEREQWLARHDERHPVLVAELDGEVAGWASITLWSDRCAYEDLAEDSLYIAEKHCGKGIGSALMKALIDEARRVKLHTLIARITGESAQSIRLHEKFGFKRVGTLKEAGRKFGRLHDVHFYQVML
jgi:phosphinothricin acetyltransferase